MMLRKMSDDEMMKELVKEEDVVITISNKGFIKRIPVTSYKSQGRGGKELLPLQPEVRMMISSNICLSVLLISILCSLLIKVSVTG